MLCGRGKIEERADDHECEEDKRAGQIEKVHSEDLELARPVILPVIAEDEAKDSPPDGDECQCDKEECGSEGSVDGELSERRGNHRRLIIACYEQKKTAASVSGAAVWRRVLILGPTEFRCGFAHNLEHAFRSTNAADLVGMVDHCSCFFPFFYAHLTFYEGDPPDNIQRDHEELLVTCTLSVVCLRQRDVIKKLSERTQ